jgi:hypothetical protein
MATLELKVEGTTVESGGFYYEKERREGIGYFSHG